jgi:hypothetical protein
MKHLDFFEFLVGIQAVNASMSSKGTEEVGSIPTAPTSFLLHW